MRVRFDEARGHVPADAEMRATIKALERPTFAYTYDVEDNRDLTDAQKANGDGRAQVGEGFTMYVTVKNVGEQGRYLVSDELEELVRWFDALDRL